MGKLSIKIILLFFLCFIGFVWLRAPAFADVGWMPGPGGVLTTDIQNDKISMQSEKVLVQIKANENLFPDYEGKYQGYYAHVQADFTMKNNTNESIAQQAFFPFYANSSMEEDPQDATWLKNILIQVDGEETNYSYKNLKQGENILACALFQVQYPASNTSAIRIVYDLHLNNRPKTSLTGFDYTMSTGATWAGVIGSGDIIIDLSPLTVKDIQAVRINNFFTTEQGKLVWRFNNLEPTTTHNIRLSFNPEVITAWNVISSYISTIQDQDGLQEARLNTNPDRSDNYVEDYQSVRSSPAYLFDQSQDLYGWYYDNSDEAQKANSNRYLQFNFDGKYTISDIKIRTGIKVNNGEKDIYTVFQQPKTIRITFSDGTYQDVSLEDTPGVLQTVRINPVPTSSISLSATDNYPGINSYLGVGRLTFEGMQSLPSESTPSSSTSSANANKKDNNLLIYISLAGICCLIVIGVSTLFFSKKKATGNPIPPHKDSGLS